MRAPKFGGGRKRVTVIIGSVVDRGPFKRQPACLAPTEPDPSRGWWMRLPASLRASPPHRSLRCSRHGRFPAPRACPDTGSSPWLARADRNRRTHRPDRSQCGFDALDAERRVLRVFENHRGPSDRTGCERCSSRASRLLLDDDADSDGRIMPARAAPVAYASFIAVDAHAPRERRRVSLLDTSSACHLRNLHCVSQRRPPRFRSRYPCPCRVFAVVHRAVSRCSNFWS